MSFSAVLQTAHWNKNIMIMNKSNNQNQESPNSLACHIHSAKCNTPPIDTRLPYVSGEKLTNWIVLIICKYIMYLNIYCILEALKSNSNCIILNSTKMFEASKLYTGYLSSFASWGFFQHSQKQKTKFKLLSCMMSSQHTANCISGKRDMLLGFFVTLIPNEEPSFNK